MLEVRQKQKEIELEALQIAFSKSISTIESFVSRASLHTFLSTIYQLFIFTSFAIVDFCYETSIKDLTTCSKCDLTLIDWKFKRNSLKAHKRQSFNCSIAQALSKDQVFSISLNSTSIESCFEATTQSIVETSTSTTSSVALVQTSKEETLASISNSSKTNFLQSISSLLDIDETLFEAHTQSKISLVANFCVMTSIFTYEERLIIFKAWSYQLSTSTSLAVVDFCYEIDIEDLTICSECELALANWRSKRDSLRAHMRQSSNCFFAQTLSKDQSKASLVDTQGFISTVEQLASAIFSGIISYLIECVICELSLNMKKIEDEDQSLKRSFLVASSRPSAELKCFEIELFASDLTQLDIDETLLRARYSINSRRSNWSIKVKGLRQRSRLLWLYNAIEFAWVSSLQL